MFIRTLRTLDENLKYRPTRRKIAIDTPFLNSIINLKLVNISDAGKVVE